MRAVIIRGFKESGDGKIHSPPKQNKQHNHKPRVKPSSMPQSALEQVQMPVATAMAVPLAAMMYDALIVPATPLPKFRCSPCPLRRSCECICVHTYPLLKIKCFGCGNGSEDKMRVLQCMWR